MAESDREDFKLGIFGRSVRKLYRIRMDIVQLTIHADVIPAIVMITTGIVGDITEMDLLDAG